MNIKHDACPPEMSHIKKKNRKRKKKTKRMNKTGLSDILNSLSIRKRRPKNEKKNEF